MRSIDLDIVSSVHILSADLEVRSKKLDIVSSVCFIISRFAARSVGRDIVLDGRFLYVQWFSRVTPSTDIYKTTTSSSAM